ncbi:MAG: hypothetical protein KBC64_00375 [Simkaniaceae bacterium]|nr:hypothetical protein [Simkaniaceae bacterium]
MIVSVRSDFDPESASLKIQSLWRGYLVRREPQDIRKIWLHYRFFEKAVALIDDRTALKSLPQSLNGRSVVLLPHKLPIVIKCTGESRGLRRWRKMESARAICIRKNYTHLIIPTARLYRGVLIERKLPEANKEFKRFLGVYIAHREKFTQAITEFVGLLFRSKFPDIVDDGRSVYAAFGGVPSGRYDNLVPFIEKEVGKIGLVDLETFAPYVGAKHLYFYFEQTRHAILLFPFHFEIIFELAKTYLPSIEEWKPALATQAQRAIEGFETLYLNHLTFIEGKGISLDQAFHPIQVSEERRGSIQVELISFFRGREEYRSLIPNFREFSSLLEEWSAHLLDELITLLVQHTKMRDWYPSSLDEIPAFRSFIRGGFFETDPFYEGLLKENKMKIENWHHRRLVYQKMIELIFSELKRGGEIAYFHPGLGQERAMVVFF